MTDDSLPFLLRLGVAFRLFFQVLFDGRRAAVLAAASTRALAEPGAAEPGRGTAEPRPAQDPARAASDEEISPDSALLLLSLLQTEGRLVDFLQQEIVGFEDAEIGAVARVVHEGCRKVLREHVELAPVRVEPEGHALTLEEGFDARAVKLTGNVGGSGPVRGTLRHRGWRAGELTLPRVVDRQSLAVVCPAEVEV